MLLTNCALAGNTATNATWAWAERYNNGGLVLE